MMALADFESSPEFTAVEKLALRYAVAITATPVELDDVLFEAMQARFDARQLVELTGAIAWENYRARFNHAFACQAEGFSQGAFCALPQTHLPDREIHQRHDHDGKEQADPHQRE